MRIALYGVSASGKDYLIGNLVAFFKDHGMVLRHVPGSSSLNAMAAARFGRGFSSLDEHERNDIRIAFAHNLQSREERFGNVVVDGHFAFPSEGGAFLDVFTDADLAAYDLFLYLDTDPKSVSHRLLDRGDALDAAAVERWQDYEVEGLSARLLAAGKELHVIRDDGELTMRYVMDAVLGGWSSKRIAQEAVGTLSLPGSPGVVCVVDCDKTLIEEDTTLLALRHRSVDAGPLARIYARDRYSNYQGMVAARWLDEVALGEQDARWVREACTPNSELVACLKARPNVTVVAVTAGLDRIWKAVLSGLGLDAQMLDTKGVMSRYVKYWVVRELQRLGHFVVAVGDSMLDSLMLEAADRSYIFAGKGRREKVAALLARNHGIRQFSFCSYQYPGTPSDPSICWVSALDQSVPEIGADIDVCRSSSGAFGARLRGAHRRLGSAVGLRIAACLPREEYVVVVMMRSGLPFGEGIADVLDCPMLFYVDKPEATAQEILSNGFEDRRVILVDGVVNTGTSLMELAGRLERFRLAVAASVVSSAARLSLDVPIFAARVSDNSYVGAKQWDVSGGRGPDTADRLFNTM